MHSVECLSDTKDKLGESPIWVEEENSIYWVDIKRFLIHKFDTKNNNKTSWQFNESIGCIAYIKKNLFIAGTQFGFKFANLESNQLIPIVDPEPDYKNNRFNDGKCDNKGRFYAGSMNDVNNEPTGSFYILYNDLTYRKFDEGYEITNGPAFSSDGKKIYFTDTRKGEIYVSNLNEAGTLIEKKLFISIPANEGKPDGMTIDQEGCIWVAIFGGSCVNRYNQQGVKIDTIKMPVSCVTSCVFGGENLDILFITTSSHKLNDQEKIKEQLAGSLFKTKLDIGGYKTNKFIQMN